MLALTFAASIGLWWWFRPVAVEEPYPFGLTTQYKIRRGWNGRKYYVGPVTLRYENGNAASIGDVNRLEQRSVGFFTGDERFQYWHEDGRKFSSSEWFFDVSQEYIPRQMNEKPIGTEEDWRRMNAGFEKKYPKSEKSVSP